MRRINDNFFSRDRKTLYMILVIVLISIFSLTIVYAALSITLNIQGMAEAVASTWNIHLDNIKVTNGSVSSEVPKITTPTTATFSATLNMPGDFYEFTIDVVNDGSIDAMIENVIKTPDLTAEQAKYLKYEITYQNGELITTKQLVSKNSFVRLKVRVEFRIDLVASDLPATTETLNLSFRLNYSQASEEGTSNVLNNGKKIVNVVSGDGTQTGDEVCIGEECFYVISSSNDSVTMLAKYNLYVGGEYNSSWVAYGDEATGKQDSTMIGFGTTPRKGTTKFSSTNYWSISTSSYPSYVYDSNSTLYSYVENYKIYLNTLGVTLIDARLITYEELAILGCSGSSCSKAASWVYSTSYWSGSASSADYVWIVGRNGTFDVGTVSNSNLCGCRPVIVIAKDKIIETDSSVKSLIEFTLGDETYQAEKGMTWQEFIDSNLNPEYEGLKIFVADTDYNIIEVLYKPEKEYMTNIYLDEEYENIVYLNDTIIDGYEYYDG